MADIWTDLRAELIGHAGLAALIGARVYPLILPQAPTLPAVTYQKIAGGVQNLLDGTSTMSRDVWQIDCWATTHAGAAAVAEQVKTCFHRFAGSMGSRTVAGVWIDDISDLFDDETKIYRVSVDIRLIY